MKVTVKIKNSISYKMRQKLLHLRGNIYKYGDRFEIPNKDNNYENLDLHAWFNSRISVSNSLDPPNFFSFNVDDENCVQNEDFTFDKIDTDGYRTRQIELKLTDNQKEIIDKWFDMHILMHNCANRYIKEKLFNGCELPGIGQMKKDLKQDKYKIQELSEIVFDMGKKKKKKVTVPSHLLDYVINDIHNMYASNIKKKKKHIIKSFRVRYLKLNKPNKIIKIEPYSVTDSSIYPASLGEKIECSVKNFNFKQHIKTVAIITKRKDKYILLIKLANKPKKPTDGHKMAFIDLGLLEFATCYTNEHIIELGTNIFNVIKKGLKKIDRINNFDKEKEKRLKIMRSKLRTRKMKKSKRDKIKKRIKKLEEQHMTDSKKRASIKKIYERLRNKVMDMQWKIADYLTKNYDSIVIGNMSTKSIGENDTTDKMVKRVANILNVYKFQLKLQYKCYRKGKNYKKTDEAYTTQCCGRCGNRNRKIGRSRVYKCNKCKITIPRDPNSARLIGISAMN